MKKILVPTDFSSSAKNAANYACQIALKNNLQIELFTTYQVLYNDGGMIIDFDQELQKSILKQLKSEESRLLKKYPQLLDRGIEYTLQMGDLDLCIRTREKKGDLTLIVMGSKGKSAWEEILIGSETARIIENSKTAVLAVPLKTKEMQIKKLVFSMDLEDKLKKSEFELINHCIDKNTHLYLFHNYSKFSMMDIPKEHHHFDDFKKWFPNNLLSLNIDYDQKTIHSIEQYAADKKPDLIITRKKHKSFLQSIFTKSVSKSLSFHTKSPLLVLK